MEEHWMEDYKTSNESKEKEDDSRRIIFMSLLAGFIGYKIGSKRMVRKFKKIFDTVRFTNGKDRIIFFYNKKTKDLVEDFCLSHQEMLDRLHDFMEERK